MKNSKGNGQRTNHKTQKGVKFRSTDNKNRSFKKAVYLGLVIIISWGIFMGCSAAKEGEGELTVLKVGASPLPHSEILEFVKDDLEQEGFALKIVEFTDYVTPNLSLDANEIDANFFQHGPYLSSFNEEHGLSLQGIFEVHVEPLGLYSKEIDTIEDLKDGAAIAIPNDPTNGGRALLLLSEFGLIDLGDEPSLQVAVGDIQRNPKNLEFVELEAPQLPRSLEDVDAAVINTNYALEADLNPSDDALISENENSPYTNVIATTEELQDSEKIQILIEVLSRERVAEFIWEQYDGAVVPVF